MTTKTIAVGHKNPDADSVLSAILVSKFSKKIFGFDVESRISGEINNETKFILDLVKEIKPKTIKKIKTENIVLVDTTEPSQIVEGLNEDNLVGIIDHHNLGGLKTSKAVFVRTENIGCTCSLIYKIAKEKGIKIDKKTAVLMLSGIISDTLNLTSPTTMADDKTFLKELAQIAKLDLKKFVEDLFRAKSSLKGISLNKVVESDYKEFGMSGKKIGIGVWETTDPETVNKNANKIYSILLDKKAKDRLDYILFGVVDILKNNSYYYIVSESERDLIKIVFDVETKECVALLNGVVSRKKQIIPPLMNYFAKLEN
jgi:manganese-dependent inorganic pyrophosphatase